MKERPILFSAPMVRAILDGTKTQTRRLVKPQPEPIPVDVPKAPGDNGWWWPAKAARSMVQIRDMGAFCPYGKLGDRLWVREAFFAWGRWETRFSAKKGRDEWHFVDMSAESGNDYLYAADGVSNTQAFIKRRGGVQPMYWMRPSIHMPRRASRILLQLVSVRVERLNDISEADALAEGIHQETVDMILGTAEAMNQREPRPAREAYRLLWEDINGPGSWAANPWVWCVEFKRVQA